MSTYKLMYFDARGVAETARYLFAISKTDYEDFRFKFSFGTPGDFSTIKRPEFDEAKEKGELVASCNKLPLLDVNGGEGRFGQSKSIERYLAAEFDMFGGNRIEGAMIDALCEAVRDIKDAYNKMKAGIPKDDEDAKKEAMTKWFDEELPSKVKDIEASLPKSKEDEKWLIGSKVSLADVTWFQFLGAKGGFFDNTEGAAAAMADCPRVKAAVTAVGELPEVQEWISKRPETMF